MKLQIEIDKLEAIVKAAKEAQKRDSSYSNTVTIEVTKQCDTHTGSDTLGVWIKSGYGECNGESIYWR